MKKLIFLSIAISLMNSESVHADARTFAEQTQSFGGQSQTYNQQIKTEAVVQKNNGANASFTTINTLVQNKQTLGKENRPKALAIEDRIKKYTATALEQKKKSGQRLTFSPQETRNIQLMALLAQNQRG